jgi:hypothetical protein
VDEGVAFSGTGRFTDASSGSPWTGTVDWGDGSGQVALDLKSDKTFPLGHTYADNSSESYTITIKIRNARGAVGTYTSKMTVRNAAPALALPGEATLPAGQTFTGLGWLTDPGTRDKPWTLTVDYGDGGGEQALQYNEQTLFFALQHIYSQPHPGGGAYIVTVRAKDKDGAIGSAQMRVNVTG